MTKRLTLLILAVIGLSMALKAQTTGSRGLPDDVFYLMPSFRDGYVYIRRLFPARKADIDSWFSAGNPLPRTVDEARALLERWAE